MGTWFLWVIRIWRNQRKKKKKFSWLFLRNISCFFVLFCFFFLCSATLRTTHVTQPKSYVSSSSASTMVALWPHWKWCEKGFKKNATRVKRQQFVSSFEKTNTARPWFLTVRRCRRLSPWECREGKGTKGAGKSAKNWTVKSEQNKTSVALKDKCEKPMLGKNVESSRTSFQCSANWITPYSNWFVLIWNPSKSVKWGEGSRTSSPQTRSSSKPYS